MSGSPSESSHASFRSAFRSRPTRGENWAIAQLEKPFKLD